MADTPESSEHMNTEETSVAEEGINLVNKSDDPALDRVDAEPRGIASIYSHIRRQAYTVVEYGNDQGRFPKELQNHEADACCSEFTHDALYMYEVVFKELGLRLPFNDF